MTWYLYNQCDGCDDIHCSDQMRLPVFHRDDGATSYGLRFESNPHAFDYVFTAEVPDPAGDDEDRSSIDRFTYVLALPRFTSARRMRQQLLLTWADVAHTHARRVASPRDWVVETNDPRMAVNGSAKSIEAWPFEHREPGEVSAKAKAYLDQWVPQQTPW